MRRALLYAFVVLAAAFVSPAVSQELPVSRPPYLVLRGSAASLPYHGRCGHYGGIAIAVETSPYAYGWFGVPPRRHWSRHFGYYREYTEWSAR